MEVIQLLLFKAKSSIDVLHALLLSAQNISHLNIVFTAN